MSNTIIQNIIEKGLQDSKWNEDNARRNRHYFYQCVYDNSYKEYIIDIVNNINSVESIRMALKKTHKNRKYSKKHYRSNCGCF